MSWLSSDILILLLLILLNGVFAMAEIAVVSARRTKLKLAAEEGDPGARKALELSEEPGRFLSTIQIGITLVGILAGAYGGAAIAPDLARLFKEYPTLKPYSDVLALSLVVLGVTYLSLVFGELLPKHIALQNPEKIAARLARPIHAVSVAAYPLVRLLSASSEGLLKVLGVRKPPPMVSEEEVKILLDEGTEAGVFHRIEQDICHRAISFEDLGIHDIMTPRPDIAWLDYEAPFEENFQKIREAGHTFFPVCRGNLDTVIGFLHLKDLFNLYPECATTDLMPLLRPPQIYPESISALDLLEHFKTSPTHMALVVDEYGVVQGLVTVNDIMEAIVGDIASFGEAEEEPILRREDGTWLVDGTTPIEAFKEHFDIERIPDEEEEDYHTLGGFVMTHLGRIPVTGETFAWNRLRFEVVDMDGNRIDKLMIRRLTDNEADAEPAQETP